MQDVKSEIYFGRIRGKSLKFQCGDIPEYSELTWLSTAKFEGDLDWLSCPTWGSREKVQRMGNFQLERLVAASTRNHWAGVWARTKSKGFQCDPQSMHLAWYGNHGAIVLDPFGSSTRKCFSSPVAKTSERKPTWHDKSHSRMPLGHDRG